MSENEFVNTVYNFMDANIYNIMYAFALAELYLIGAIYIKLKNQANRLSDATDNLLKGFNDCPDKDSGLHLHEKIESTLRFITNKIQHDESARLIIRQNAGKLAERSAENRYFGLEMYASVMSTLVQVFPLLGILGTVIAIAKTDMKSGVAAAEQISEAFVMAMETTILGIALSVVFMVIESALHPKIERSIGDSKEYKDVINSVYLS